MAEIFWQALGLPAGKTFLEAVLSYQHNCHVFGLYLCMCAHRQEQLINTIPWPNKFEIHFQSICQC
jgi:hypothetical protein